MKAKLLVGTIVVVAAWLALFAASQRAPAGTPRPSEGWTLHITAKKHFPGKPEMLAHHFCKGVSGGLTECQVYDNGAPDAHLVGVEVIVDPAIQNEPTGKPSITVVPKPKQAKHN
jgi:hypothetical protein